MQSTPIHETTPSDDANPPRMPVVRMVRLLLLLLCALMWQGPALAALGAANIAIAGRVVTADAVLPFGWIVLINGKIASVSTTMPSLAGLTVLRTEDTIYPGFVDLHNHPLFNTVAPWRAPQRYDNRYQWRVDPGQRSAVATPARRLLLDGFCDVVEFAEIKALIGGTTSLTGVSHPAPWVNALHNIFNQAQDLAEQAGRSLSGRRGAPVQARLSIEQCLAGLARNLDWASAFPARVASEARVRTAIGIGADDMSGAESSQIRRDLVAGKIDLFAIHLAEGRRTDPRTNMEFSALERAGLLGPHTALVHGISLDRQQLQTVRSAGASLIWSPKSNIGLYGETLDVLAAIAAGIPVALAPDWSPTGSANMLQELQFAHHYSMHRLGGAISTRALFEMATIVPARIAHIDDKVGSVAVGNYGDLFLLAGQRDDPYDALARARPGDITMVLVGGIPVYGQDAYLAQLGVHQREPVVVCSFRRALNSAALPAGPLSAVMTRLRHALAGSAAQLSALIDCAV